MFLPSVSFAVSVAPLTASSFAIRIHAFAAMAAFGIGLWQLLGRKGTVPHRVLGWLWVGLMAIVALSSFWISELKSWGPFSAIHLLSIFVLIQLPLAVMAARRHNIRAHKITMVSMFFGALVVAGAFTCLPGRIMYRVMFG
ncbi:MAG: hypothetical protein RL291_772 [Pseudomonadota bacterium]